MSTDGYRHRGRAPGWTTTLTLTGNVLTVQRSSDEPEFRARLMHTARILAALDHPGAERFLALEDRSDRTTLVTGFAGGRSLAADGPRRARDVAVLATTLVHTLDELHTIGVTHGPIERADVRFAVGHVPVLCGFDHGRLHSAGDRDSWQVDRVADVRSVGFLLAGLADEATPGHAIDRVDRHRLARLSHRIIDGELTETSALLAALARITPRR